MQAPLVVFCAAGKRATLAQAFLSQLGYSAVMNGGSVERVRAAMAAD